MKPINSILYEVFSYLLILVFIYSLILKVGNIQQFEINLFISHLIPESLIQFLFYAILIMESLVVLGLIFFAHKKLTNYYVVFVVCILTFYLVLFELTKEEDCGCGRLLAELSFWPHLGFNLALIFISLFMLKLNRKK